MALIRIPQSGFENAWFIEYENHPFVLAMYHLYLACSTYSRTLVVMLSVFRVVMAYYPKDHMYTNNWIGFSFVIIYPMILYFTYQAPVFEFHSQLAQYFSSNRTDATLELNWKIMIIPNFPLSMVLLSCCVFLLAVYLFKFRDTFFVPTGSRSRERSFRNELAWTLTTAACFYHFLEDTLVEIFSNLSQEIFGDLISILPFTHNIGNLFIAVIFWATHPIFGRNGLISTYRMETRNQ
ncbi:hypothetical protein L5515_019598 [Caenorhabditis briggsae]|nr:hypothetical protein L5515_019598 [Caenorhabditis briggsae]